MGDLLSDAVVKLFFARANLVVAQPGEQIADPGGDELMGVEHLDQVFLGDRGILSEIRPGPLDDPLIGEIAAAGQHEQWRQD